MKPRIKYDISSEKYYSINDVQKLLGYKTVETIRLLIRNNKFNRDHMKQVKGGVGKPVYEIKGTGLIEFIASHDKPKRNSNALGS
ncbi:MAG TPA: hypothetical protein PLP73_04210 [Candidatus Absconditabacterales bacterium]|nr:hypothetical protein [Candidatus Absconditabacterales bacterium]